MAYIEIPETVGFAAFIIIWLGLGTVFLATFIFAPRSEIGHFPAGLSGGLGLFFWGSFLWMLNKKYGIVGMTG